MEEPPWRPFHAELPRKRSTIRTVNCPVGWLSLLCPQDRPPRPAQPSAALGVLLPRLGVASFPVLCGHTPGRRPSPRGPQPFLCAVTQDSLGRAVLPETLLPVPGLPAQPGSRLQRRHLPRACVAVPGPPGAGPGLPGQPDPQGAEGAGPVWHHSLSCSRWGRGSRLTGSGRRLSHRWHETRVPCLQGSSALRAQTRPSLDPRVCHAAGVWK